MGMFDYVRCEMPLPASREAPPSGTLFQTKDTPDQWLTTYTITAEGRLSWRPYRMEEVPKSERPYPDAPDDDWQSLCGSLRRVEEEPETLDDFHGDVNFYEYVNGKWWEYRARFTDGVCAAIQLTTEPASGTPPAEDAGGSGVATPCAAAADLSQES